MTVVLEDPTPEQRAAWALSRACNGWRANKVCINRATNIALPTPHPGCLRAQLEHDLILDEHRSDH